MTMQLSEELSPEMIEKATEALSRSNFWEFAELTLTLELALACALNDGQRGPNRLRRAAKRMLPKVSDTLMRKFVGDISSSGKAVEKLEELKAYKDKLISMIAKEFAEAEKFADVGEYRRQRAERETRKVA